MPGIGSTAWFSFEELVLGGGSLLASDMLDDGWRSSGVIGFVVDVQW